MLVDILGYTPNMPTKIGTLSLDIVRNIEYQYDQEVSSHPVETGFEIQDNAVNHPLKITMRAGVSSHPVTWFYVNGIGKSKFNDAIAVLEAIRDAKMPVTILRPDRILNDMYLTSCRPVKDSESKSVRWIDLTLLTLLLKSRQGRLRQTAVRLRRRTLDLYPLLQRPLGQQMPPKVLPRLLTTEHWRLKLLITLLKHFRK